MLIYFTETFLHSSLETKMTLLTEGTENHEKSSRHLVNTYPVSMIGCAVLDTRTQRWIPLGEFALLERKLGRGKRYYSSNSIQTDFIVINILAGKK